MEVDYGEVYSRETEGGGGGLVTHALSELRASVVLLPFTLSALTLRRCTIAGGELASASNSSSDDIMCRLTWQLQPKGI